MAKNGWQKLECSVYDSKELNNRLPTVKPARHVRKYSLVTDFVPIYKNNEHFSKRNNKTFFRLSNLLTCNSKPFRPPQTNPLNCIEGKTCIYPRKPLNKNTAYIPSFMPLTKGKENSKAVPDPSIYKRRGSSQSQCENQTEVKIFEKALTGSLQKGTIHKKFKKSVDYKYFKVPELFQLFSGKLFLKTPSQPKKEMSMHRRCESEVKHPIEEKKVTKLAQFFEEEPLGPWNENFEVDLYQ